MKTITAPASALAFVLATTIFATSANGEDAPRPADVASAPAQVVSSDENAPTTKSATQVLSIQAAIETALTYNLDRKIAEHQTRSARADVLTARAPLLPQVNLSASYGLNLDVPYGRANDTYQNFNVSVSGEQLIYDFGKTKKRWKAAQATATSMESTQLATRRAVIHSVRNAFFDVLEARALAFVGEKTLENHERHLEQTQAMVNVGTKPTIDLVKLKSAAAAAKASLIQVKGNERIARAQLSFLIGQPIPEDIELQEPSHDPLSYEVMPPAQLFEKALDARPEFASQKAIIRVRRLQLESAESNAYPSLYATSGINWGGRHIKESGLGLGVGLRLGWNIFDGFSNKGTRIAAEETLAVEELRLKKQEDQVRTALEEATLNTTAAITALSALDEALEAANILLSSAEERYAAGVGNIIELTDAQYDVAEAESKRVRGVYDLLSARAALLDAVGVEEWN